MIPLTLGRAPVSLPDLVEVARVHRPVILDAALRPRIDAGAAFLARLLAEGREVYGVNTGYGDSVTVAIPREHLEALPLHLTRFHGVGSGRLLEPVEVRAVLLARLVSLAQGASAVRWVVLEALAGLLREDLLPRIPAEGSVGASGDLTPLSYVAAVLVGEREVLRDGAPVPAATALAEAGLAPLILAPKEGLALMNGTAVMTALGALAWDRAHRLCTLGSRLTAFATAALESPRAHFHPRLFELKAHAGPRAVADRLWTDLSGADPDAAHRLQDRYSIRCAPHVLGVLEDALGWIRRDLEAELNSANDNPLVDPEAELLLHGGHFYGGHVAFAMDALKTAVANVADLLDRQLALLVDPRYSEGLPPNLSGAEPHRTSLNHGLKAAQIAASACTAEALKLCMPASVFSRSTECHNQDKVSLGTIAARDALRVLELTEQVAAIHTLATVQALRLRGPGAQARLGVEARGALERLAERLPFVQEDQPLESVLRALALDLKEGRPW